jgi:hypothetical protein
MGRIIYFQVGDRDRITFPELVRSLCNILGILEDLDASLSKRKSGTVRWEVVSLRKGSPPIIGIEGHPVSSKVDDLTPAIQREVFQGVATLANTPERSRYYSDSVLSKLRKLAYQSRQTGPLTIYTENGEARQETSITESTLQNIEQIIGVKYKGLGSVVGSLDAIILHSKNEFRIWNENTGKPVTCLFAPEKLEDVKALLRTKVLVYGEVRSNQRGEPIAITVEGIERRTPQDKLPTIEEMSGLVEDMYEGKALEEYLKDIRDE